MMNMEILTVPIKFDKQKHVMIFLIILCIILFIFLFLEVFFDYFPISHRRELPYFIKVILMLVMGGWLFVLIKMVFSNSPHIILEKDSIALLNPLKNTYDAFYFKDIENIEFGFGKSAMMGIYLKNQPPLSNANKFIRLLIITSMVKSYILGKWRMSSVKFLIIITIITKTQSC